MEHRGAGANRGAPRRSRAEESRRPGGWRERATITAAAALLALLAWAVVKRWRLATPKRKFPWRDSRDRAIDDGRAGGWTVQGDEDDGAPSSPPVRRDRGTRRAWVAA